MALPDLACHLYVVVTPNVSERVAHVMIATAMRRLAKMKLKAECSTTWQVAP
jgi:hypothetical protein